MKRHGRVGDFLFYGSFGVVVTSSVRVAGVLLVFSYLIVPALAGIMLGRGIRSRLAIGWGFGTLVSVIAMLASAILDLPTGLTIVCAFGVMLLALGVLVARTGRSERLASAALASAADRSASGRAAQ